MGVGNFFDRMPEEIKNSSQLYGVEIDSLSGRIAQLLYPEADIVIQGFEKNQFQKGCFDVAVGNVPFGELGFRDDVHGTFKLHDYFFAETLDKVKDGGMIAFITSTGSLDKKDPSVRQMLAEKADLIGAIRLPGDKNGAFKKNAGTEVTTDIFFLQKKSQKFVSEMSDVSEWVHVGVTEDGLPINQYFANHPEMVLGTIVEGNKLYGSGTMVVAEEGANIRQLLHDAVRKLSATISKNRPRDVYAKTALGETVRIPSNLRNYSFLCKGMTACMKGAASHTTKLIESLAHNLNRIESALYNIDGRIQKVQDSLAKLRLDFTEAQKIVAEPFPQEDELAEKEERLKALTAELNFAAIEAKKNAPRREKTCYFERAKMKRDAMRVAKKPPKGKSKGKSDQISDR